MEHIGPAFARARDDIAVKRSTVFSSRPSSAPRVARVGQWRSPEIIASSVSSPCRSPRNPVSGQSLSLRPVSIPASFEHLKEAIGKADKGIFASSTQGAASTGRPRKTMSYTKISRLRDNTKFFSSGTEQESFAQSARTATRPVHITRSTVKIPTAPPPRTPVAHDEERTEHLPGEEKSKVHFSEPTPKRFVDPPAATPTLNISERFAESAARLRKLIADLQNISTIALEAMAKHPPPLGLDSHGRPSPYEKFSRLQHEEDCLSLKRIISNHVASAVTPYVFRGCVLAESPAATTKDIQALTAHATAVVIFSSVGAMARPHPLSTGNDAADTNPFVDSLLAQLQQVVETLSYEVSPGSRWWSDSFVAPTVTFGEEKSTKTADSHRDESDFAPPPSTANQKKEMLRHHYICLRGAAKHLLLLKASNDDDPDNCILVASPLVRRVAAVLPRQIFALLVPIFDWHDAKDAFDSQLRRKRDSAELRRQAESQRPVPSSNVSRPPPAKATTCAPPQPIPPMMASGGGNATRPGSARPASARSAARPPSARFKQAREAEVPLPNSTPTAELSQTMVFSSCLTASSAIEAMRRLDHRWIHLETNQASITAGQILEAASLPAALSGSCVIPWPESVIAGLDRLLSQQQSSTEARMLFAPSEGQYVTAWLKNAQRRFHPDKFQAMILQRLPNTSDATVADRGDYSAAVQRLLSRVTRISQSINSLRDRLKMYL